MGAHVVKLKVILSFLVVAVIWNLANEFYSVSEGNELSKKESMLSDEISLSFCSNEYLEKISRKFYVYPNKGKEEIPRLAHFSSCPIFSWLDSFLAQKDIDKEFLGVNVGCNKGHEAVNMLRILSKNPKYSLKQWNEHVKGQQICRSDPETEITNQDKTSFGLVFCIEPVRSTVKMLEKASYLIDYAESLKIRELAISNTTGEIFFPDMKIGAEAGSLGGCEKDPSKCVKVPVTTLDEFMQTEKQSNKHIDMLLIDAEGFDYNVIMGAKKSIEQTNILVFEVHSQGTWPKVSLMSLIEQDLNAFVCYWAGVNKLWRITQCTTKDMSANYDNEKTWSNVICLSKKDIILINEAEKIFRLTMKSEV